MWRLHAENLSTQHWCLCIAGAHLHALAELGGLRIGRCCALRRGGYRCLQVQLLLQGILCIAK